MYRREDDIIILYNLFTLIYMPFWFVLFFVYNFEFPPRPYSDPYREYDRETYQLFFFFLIYAVERVLGFTLRINRYVVIICNLITFYPFYIAHSSPFRWYNARQRSTSNLCLSIDSKTIDSVVGDNCRFDHDKIERFR